MIILLVLNWDLKKVIYLMFADVCTICRSIHGLTQQLDPLFILTDHLLSFVCAITYSIVNGALSYSCSLFEGVILQSILTRCIDFNVYF